MVEAAPVLSDERPADAAAAAAASSSSSAAAGFGFAGGFLASV